MDKRATIGILAGVGALVALLFASRSYGAEFESAEVEEKGDGIFQYDFFQEETGMNYKVNEYPKYASAIAEAERRYNLPTDLLARVLYQESRYRPDIISGEKRSPVGAMGIAQFMPLTGEEYGLVVYNLPVRDNMGNRIHDRTIVQDMRTNPIASIDAAGRYLRALYRMFNNWRDALMAYNWGPGNVAKYNRGEKTTVPIETSDYVAQITADVNVA